MSYPSKEKAEELSGIAESEMSDAMIASIDNWINTKFRPEGFIELEADELYHVNDNRINKLILKNFPVTEITEITNDVNGTPVILADDSYIVDNETGILYLKESNDDEIYSFTKGIFNVRIKYKYGFVSVPNDIMEFATLLLAKWVSVSNAQAEADGNLKSIKIGDYSESYDLSFMSVTSQYDNGIDSLKTKLVARYVRSV